jgi:hypothetical protein
MIGARLGWKMIFPMDESAFALAIAARKEPGPAFSELVT